MNNSDVTQTFKGAFQKIVESRRRNIVKLCSDLVQAYSVNPPGDTVTVAQVVRDALRALDIDSHFVSRTDRMPNVVSTFDTGRPGQHLVLNVHMDTMPAGDEAQWSVDPYTLTTVDKRLYGLGMGNMKGAVAAMIHAYAILSENKESLCGKVTFTAVSDEVVFGDNGASYLLKNDPLLVGDGLICGEGPGFGRLAVSEKGVLWLRLTALGDSGHSSAVRHMGSATARLAKAVSRIDEFNGTSCMPPEALEPHFNPTDAGFNLSANIGRIEAGSFIGQIAQNGYAEIDLRVPPGMTCDETQYLVAQIADEVGGINVERIKGWDPTWTDLNNPLSIAWKKAYAALMGTEVALNLAIRLPASDASRWRRLGVPALCFGPQPTLSAGIDDYAEEDEVLRCAVLYALSGANFLLRDPWLT